MTNQHPEPTPGDEIPEAVVARRSGISIVWLIPVIAALIGGWLAWKAFSEQGATITISFESAEGLVAGKTKIKFKDVEIGLVDSVDISDDLSHVVVTAELEKGVELYLTDRTRFWVVKASVKAGQVTGLGTIFSGAYIGIDPVTGGNPTRDFVGLETPPVVTTDQPGRHFIIQAEQRGSLDVGVPVFYRQIEVGEVVAYEISEDGETINFKVFVHAPYDEKVHENTRFWDVSGFNVSLNAEGIKLDTGSLVSMMIGGIAFGTPENHEVGAPVQDGQVFSLYESRAATREEKYVDKHRFLLYFDGSVRGLAAGAPVEFRGIKIGQVIDIRLELDLTTQKFRIPVVIEIEPERVTDTGVLPEDWEQLDNAEQNRRFWGKLVDEGMRAQLKSGNILTGALFIDMDLHTEVAAAEVDYSGKMPVLPTIPTSVEEITAGVTRLVKKLERFPVDEIGASLQKTMAGLNQTVSQTEKTLVSLERVLSADSPLRVELQQTLDELSDAARSMRLLADYLERHPEALIRGKER